MASFLADGVLTCKEVQLSKPSPEKLVQALRISMREESRQHRVKYETLRRRSLEQLQALGDEYVESLGNFERRAVESLVDVERRAVERLVDVERLSTERIVRFSKRCLEAPDSDEEPAVP